MRYILWFLSVLATLATIMGLAGCDKSIEFSNSAPGNIRITKDKCYMSAGTVVALSATASDPDEDEISFSWTVSGGALSPSSGEGAAVSWTAPGEGAYTVTVNVTDGIDSSSRSIEILVGEQVLVLPGTNELTDNGTYYIFNQARHIMIEYLSSLTIHEGVTIVFDNAYAGMTVRGELHVLGTEEDPVVFRSNYCPGGSATDWEGLMFEKS
ncbi:MAG TPA: PKD domain-containing protein, partial [Candidatus Krumholzibacterium sp.]|nr:PKD domain-containing protein [Candidatus Krumholzibacterium sp.]